MEYIFISWILLKVIGVTTLLPFIPEHPKKSKDWQLVFSANGQIMMVANVEIQDQPMDID